MLLTCCFAQTFCRKFRWHELILWPEDMPAHALVALSDKDDLVPSSLVAKHISDTHPTATVMYHPTAGHGGFLIDLPWQRSLVQVGKHSVTVTSPLSMFWESTDLPGERSALQVGKQPASDISRITMVWELNKQQGRTIGTGWPHCCFHCAETHLCDVCFLSQHPLLWGPVSRRW